MIEKNNIENTFNLAEKNHKQNNLIEAKNLYESILKIEPNHLNSIFRLGSLFAQLNNFDKAKFFLKKTIDIKPSHSKAYNNLGIVFNKQKEHEKAKFFFEKSIEINSNNEEAYNNLGLTLFELGDFENSMHKYHKAIKINPNHKDAIKNICILFRQFNINFSKSLNKDELKKLFLILYRRDDIEHKDIFSNAKKILLNEKNYFHLKEVFNLDKIIEKDFVKKLINDELFLLILQKSLVSDISFEKMLNKIRYEVLSSLFEKNSNILKIYLEFVISLSEQCFLNEYCFYKSREELNWIKKLKISCKDKNKINELEIAVLGCYIPLFSFEPIVKKLLTYRSKNKLFNNLINMQIKEPLEEKNLIEDIKTFESISDSISEKVRDQYEENPFPRWRYTYNKTQSNSLVIVNNQIRPNKIETNDKFDNPNVLIAGCGTGKQVFIAQNYSNAKILAVDLSKKSLAYAKRKVEESKIENVEFLHADILNLDKLDKKFDIIECIGVLHHMNRPLEGLKVLINILKPNGLMKLGLYSEIARKNIKQAKQLIVKKNYKNNYEDILSFRQEIMREKENDLLKKIPQRLDFYSTSGIRDLLFHVKEHRFTLLQLSEIISKFSLEFLGFSDSDIKKKYSNFNSKDKKNILLQDWHKFELENQNVFLRMYNFWVKKKL